MYLGYTGVIEQKQCYMEYSINYTREKQNAMMMINANEEGERESVNTRLNGFSAYRNAGFEREITSGKKLRRTSFGLLFVRSKRTN